MQIKLSRINKGMTLEFDTFIKKIWLEGLGDMGKDGNANRSGMAANAPQTSSGSPPATTSATTSQAPQGQQEGAIDVGAVLSDKTMKGQWKDWLSKPYNQTAFNSHVMNTMFDPKGDPSKSTELLNTVSQDPDLTEYINNLKGNMSKPQQ
jgi:hypothetical protein